MVCIGQFTTCFSIKVTFHARIKKKSQLLLQILFLFKIDNNSARSGAKKKKKKHP